MNSLLSAISILDHILVVDDVADDSFLLQVLLEDKGYQVEVDNTLEFTVPSNI